MHNENAIQLDAQHPLQWPSMGEGCLPRKCLPMGGVCLVSAQEGVLRGVHAQKGCLPDTPYNKASCVLHNHIVRLLLFFNVMGTTLPLTTTKFHI